MKTEKKGILFINYSIGNGGSEKMFLYIMNGSELVDCKKIIFLYNNSTRHSYGSLIKVPYTKYTYSKESDYFFINLVKRIRILLRIIRKENVSLIFSFSSQGALLAVVGKILLPLRKIGVAVRLGSVFSNLFYNPKGSKVKRKIWEQLTLIFTYKHVDKIVCSTLYMKQELLNRSKRLKSKIVVIKNYVDKENVNSLANEPVDIKGKYFISVGRLEKEKNYFEILEAFFAIKDRTKINLLILGDGSLREEIHQTILNYGLKKRVILLGFKRNPYKYIAKAEGLILFSDFEGLPNVVIEALMCKTPVIVSNYLGVEDVIRHRWNGIIVKRRNKKGLALALEELLEDEELRKKLVKNGYRKALEFTTSITKYEQLINGLL